MIIENSLFTWMNMNKIQIGKNAAKNIGVEYAIANIEHIASATGPRTQFILLGTWNQIEWHQKQRLPFNWLNPILHGHFVGLMTHRETELSPPCILRILYTLGVKPSTNMEQLLKINLWPKNLLIMQFVLTSSIFQRHPLIYNIAWLYEMVQK